MFERYSESARRTVFYARHQASHGKLGQISTANLVIGAALEVRRSGIKSSPLHDRWDELVTVFGGPAMEPCPPDQNWPLSDTSKRALAYAAVEANRDQRYAIDQDHLLRGVLRTKDDTARKLVKVGLDLTYVRKASAPTNKKRSTSLRVFKFWWSVYRRRVLFAIAVVLFVAAVYYLRSQN